MEHVNQPRGDTNKINDQRVENDVVVPMQLEINTEAPTADVPPLTFADAEQRNPFSVLVELHDHALTFDGEHRRPQDAAHHLAELALSSAVVAWWTRWRPISVHRAFLSGASLAEVAAATGLSETDAYACWQSWAEAQSALIIGDKPSVAAEEVEHIRARLGGDR